MDFNELYPKKKEYYYLLRRIKTLAECYGVPNFIIDKQEAKLLMRYLNKKEKEIERFNENNQAYQKELCKVWDERDNAYRIINELEKELKFQRKISLSLNESFAVSIIDILINKLQELKGSDKE